MALSSSRSTTRALRVSSFVNFADPRSCDRAVGEMDHFIVHGFELLVNMAKVDQLDIVSKRRTAIVA